MLQKTISRVFLAPTLGINKLEAEKQGLINSFLKDESAGIEEKDSVILAFRPADETGFQQFLNSEIKRTKSLTRHYSYPSGIKMLVYKLDPKYASDYELVKQGKYSKTSKTFQGLFPKFVKVKSLFGVEEEKISLQYRVFNKTIDVRRFWETRLGVDFSEDQELWPIMSLEKETFQIDSYLLANAS
jgi:hypothetical protein